MKAKRITIGSLLLLTAGWAISLPQVEYRMDECQWVGGGVTDVRDHTSHALDGEAMNGAQVDRNDAKAGFSGNFNPTGDTEQHVVISHDALLDFDTKMTVTLWVKPSDSEDSHLLNKYDNSDTQDNADDLGFKIHYNDRKDQLRFVLVTTDGGFHRLNLSVLPSDWSDGEWHFVSARYDGTEMFLSFDDVNETKAVTGSVVNATAKDLFVGMKQNGSKELTGKLDEIKIWSSALTDSEIEQIRSNENAGKNYDDGSDREVPVCEGSIDAHQWKLIGIPADLRDGSYGIVDIMGDDFSGAYDTEWRLYKREYSDVNNSSWYTYVSDTSTPLEFGKGYWLGSRNNETWSVNDLPGVDYNASCISGQGSERCVEIPVVPVSLSEEDGDDLQCTGPYRYNMLGFTGTVPVHWSQCRIVVDGTAYTPSESEDRNYTSSQVWVYNPGDAAANSNGYTTFTDADSNDWLLPYNGFWIELRYASKGKNIKLLIPQE